MEGLEGAGRHSWVRWRVASKWKIVQEIVAGTGG